MGIYFIHTRELLIWASRNLSFSFRNFSFSYASLAKALTTRLPLIFSWTKAFSEEKHSLFLWKAGFTSFDCMKVAMAVKGSTASMHSASFALMVKSISKAKANSRTFW